MSLSQSEIVQLGAPALGDEYVYYITVYPDLTVGVDIIQQSAGEVVASSKKYLITNYMGNNRDNKAVVAACHDALYSLKQKQKYEKLKERWM